MDNLAPPPAVPRVAEDHPIPAAWEQELNTPRTEPASSAAPASVDLFEGVDELGRAPITKIQATRTKPEHLACECCGATMQPDELGHAAVARIVKPGNRYGNASAGKLVWVEPSELRGAVLEATLGLSEYRVRYAPKPAPTAPQKGMVTQMVEATMDAAIAASKSLLEQGKARAERERQRLAAEAADLAPRPRAVDQEGVSQPTRNVEGSDL